MRSWLILVMTLCFFSLSAEDHTWDEELISAANMGSSTISQPPTSSSPASQSKSSTATKKDKPPEKPKTPKVETPQVTLVPERKVHYPGEVGLYQGTWISGDNLLNLANQISIAVQIVTPETNNPLINTKDQNKPAQSTLKPETKNLLVITEDQIKSVVEKTFREGGLLPSSGLAGGGPGLPAYQVQILLYPIGNVGFAAFIEGSLFESIKLDRFYLVPGTYMEAITWQSKKLILVSNTQALAEVTKTVTEITKSFVERVEFFQGRLREIRK